MKTACMSLFEKLHVHTIPGNQNERGEGVEQTACEVQYCTVLAVSKDLPSTIITLLIDKGVVDILRRVRGPKQTNLK
jgi:hypothetical protein